MAVVRATKSLWQRLSRLGALGLAYFLLALPLRVYFELVRSLGLLNYHLNGTQRQAALANLSATFPDRYSPADLQTCCRQHFRVRSAKYINFLAYPALSVEWLSRYMRIDNLDLFLSGFKNGKGVIVTGIHTGDMNLTVPVVSTLCRCHVIRMGRVDEVQRLTSGRVFGTHEPLRGLYRALGNGDCLALAVDGIAGKKLVPVKFLGHQIYVQPTVPRLVRHTGSTIIPMISRLGSENRYEMVFLAPVSYQEDLDQPDFHQRVMQKIFSTYEPYIQADPAQWHLWPFLDIMRLPAESRPAEFIYRR